MSKHRAVFYGTSSDDTFTAIHGNDFIYAGDGDDVIEDSGRSYDNDFYFGQGGDDLIFIHGGNDTIKGGTGNDRVNSGSTQDFSFDGGFGNDTLEFFMPEYHSYSFSYPDTDKTVIKVYNTETLDVLYKIVTWDVENFEIYGVGGI